MWRSPVTKGEVPSRTAGGLKVCPNPPPEGVKLTPKREPFSPLPDSDDPSEYWPYLTGTG